MCEQVIGADGRTVYRLDPAVKETVEALTVQVAFYHVQADGMAEGIRTLLDLVDSTQAVIARNLPTGNRPGWAQELLTGLGAVIEAARLNGWLPSAAGTDTIRQ